MKCPFCVAEGERSTIYAPNSCFSTAMDWQPYYDEDGEYHDHDPNTRSEELRCSRGHRWARSYVRSCKSCDYGKDSEKIVPLHEVKV